MAREVQEFVFYDSEFDYFMIFNVSNEVVIYCFMVVWEEDFM